MSLIIHTLPPCRQRGHQTVAMRNPNLRVIVNYSVPLKMEVEQKTPCHPPLATDRRHGDLEIGTLAYLAPFDKNMVVIRIPMFETKTTWQFGRLNDSAEYSYGNDIVLASQWIGT